MSGCDADVKGIDGGFLRQRALPNQFARQLRCRFGEPENRNPAKCPQPPGPLARIANASFIENQL